MMKPFSCTVKECEATFTTEDHLSVHIKKHELMLNCNLANKNCVIADQTPTPTRFLKNCDEMGLFQDLQIVNPFEEMFKKATENGKHETLQVETTNDDTLHTPKILPLVQGSQQQMSEVKMIPSPQFLSISIPDNSIPVLVINDNDAYETSQVTEKQNVMDTTTSQPIQVEQTKRGKDMSASKKEQIKEMNRAAQYRCRQRKKEEMKNFFKVFKQRQDSYEKLLRERNYLMQENIRLREKVIVLTKKLEDRNGVAVETLNAQNTSPILIKVMPPIVQTKVLVETTSFEDNSVLHDGTSKYRKIIPKK